MDLETVREAFDNEHLRDEDLASALEAYILNDNERAELKKRKISVIEAIVGSWTDTASNEKFLRSAMRRWNMVLERNIFRTE